MSKSRGVVLVFDTSRLFAALAAEHEAVGRIVAAEDHARAPDDLGVVDADEATVRPPEGSAAASRQGATMTRIGPWNTV
jgi:hypothetical protein